MESKDFLKRYLDQLAKVLAHIVGLKKEKKHEEAIVFLDEALHAYFEFDIEQLNGLSPESAYDKIKSETKSMEQFECITELIYERGLIKLQSGNKEDSDWLFKLSCYLFKYLNTNSKVFNMDREMKRQYLEKIYLN